MSEASATDVGSLSSNGLSMIASWALGLQLRFYGCGEAVHDLRALAHDDAVAQRPELAEDADVRREPQRGPTLGVRQADVEVHLDDAVDGRVAAARARAQPLRRAHLEDLDLQRELHPERADLLADDGGVAPALLERANLLRARDARGQPRHVPEQVPHRLPRS